MSSRLLLPFLAPVLLMALLMALLGCSGGSGEAEQPTPVLLRPTLEPAHEFVPGVHRYIAESDRLVIPTLTPMPTPTPTLRSAPVFSGSGTPEPSSDALQVSMDDADESLGCTAQYRRMLVSYRGRIPFGAEVAQSLAADLLELRSDCVEDGWAPEFTSSRACIRGRVAGVSISPGLSGRSNSIALPAAFVSGRDDQGNILLHFARVPHQDSPGCWYYSAGREAWAWMVLGGDSGVDRRSFPLCDGRLREMISASAGPGFGPADVARTADEVRLWFPDHCGSPLWNLFPSAYPNEDCGSLSGTGIDPDGSLVVTWHADYTPSDYAVCWVLAAGADAWDVYYVRDAPDGGGDS